MELESNYKIVEFDPEVLREYDIRGIVDQNITENTAYTIGRVFGYIVYEKLNSSIGCMYTIIALLVTDKNSILMNIGQTNTG